MGLEKKQAVYLIDSENVACGWTRFLDSMNAGDRVVFFYTEHCTKFSVDDLRKIMESHIKMDFIRCYYGQANALDFQICAVVGYLYGNDPDCSYVVVSNDRGYDAMVLYMQRLGADVHRMKVEFTEPVSMFDLNMNLNDMDDVSRAEIMLSDLCSEDGADVRDTGTGDGVLAEAGVGDGDAKPVSALAEPVNAKGDGGSMKPEKPAKVTESAPVQPNKKKKTYGSARACLQAAGASGADIKKINKILAETTDEKPNRKHPLGISKCTLVHNEMNRQLGNAKCKLYYHALRDSGFV